MTNKSITILSSRGRGISADLSYMRTHLMRENDMSHVSFRSFSKNERTDNDLVNQGVTKMRRQFCENAAHIICVDASLSGKANAEGQRLLLASPYDYQFKNVMRAQKGERRIGTLRKFSHIIAGSPFTEKLLRDRYRLDGTEVIPHVALPLAWEVCRREPGEHMREKAALYFPEVKEKRVLYLLMAKMEDGGRQPFFGELSLRDFLDGLGDGWMVFTNSEAFMEAACALPERYRTSFAYIHQRMQVHELLYITDVLVTNNGRMAAAFAGRGKPVYCSLCHNSSFEQYMRAHYRELCIANAKELALKPLGEGEISEQGRDFCRTFYYDGAENPYETAAGIFGLIPRKARTS